MSRESSYDKGVDAALKEMEIVLGSGELRSGIINSWTDFKNRIISGSTRRHAGNITTQRKFKSKPIIPWGVASEETIAVSICEVCNKKFIYVQSINRGIGKRTCLDPECLKILNKRINDELFHPEKRVITIKPVRKIIGKVTKNKRIFPRPKARKWDKNGNLL